LKWLQRKRENKKTALESAVKCITWLANCALCFCCFCGAHVWWSSYRKQSRKLLIECVFRVSPVQITSHTFLVTVVVVPANVCVLFVLSLNSLYFQTVQKLWYNPSAVKKLLELTCVWKWYFILLCFLWRLIWMYMDWTPESLRLV